MRGGDQTTRWSFQLRSDRRAASRKDHPLRLIRERRGRGAGALSTGSSTRSTRRNGRPSIPPEQLLRALLLQAFYTIRSERQLMEQLDYNLLFRWFVGLSVDDPVWVPTVFSKNRDRLLEGDIAAGVHGGGAEPATGQGRCCRTSTSRSTAR